MGLRTKIAAIFLALLLIPIVAIAVAQIDRVSALMVEDLRDSANLLLNQTYEAMRSTPLPAHADPILVLRNDPSLRSLLVSSQAFGKGVVYLRIEQPNGTIIAGPEAGSSSGSRAAQSFAGLEQIAFKGSTIKRLRALWDPHMYELTRAVNLGGRPFAIIAVGISTSLITPQVHRVFGRVVFAAAEALALALAGAMLAGAWLIRRLGAIISSVERMATGGGAATVRVTGSDELSRLGDRVNQLSDRIVSDQTQWQIERERLLDRFRSIDDAILVLDGGLIIRFANAEAQGRLGLPAGGVADGRSLAELLGADHPLVRLTQNAMSAATGLHDVPLQPDSEFPQIASIFPLSEKDASSGMMVILRNLGPLKSRSPQEPASIEQSEAA